MWPWLESTLEALQVAANVGALIAGAIIWRLYVGRLKAALTAKEAEISSVEKNRDMWRDKAVELEKRSPEIMESVLTQRIHIREEEIGRLGEDKSRHEARLSALEREKARLDEDLARTRGFRLMLKLDGAYEDESSLAEQQDECQTSIRGESSELEVVLLGEVGVDSGQLLITDPCYIDSEWAHEPFDPTARDFAELEAGAGGESPTPMAARYSYRGACETTLSYGYGELAYRNGHAGAGVALRTAWGDGGYPVYGELHNGRIVRVYISAE